MQNKTIKTKMNILYISHNSSLRSTTCVLDAVFNHLHAEINPTIVFSKTGPWQQSLEKSGVNTIVKNFQAVSFNKPFSSLCMLVYWITLFKRKKIAIVHVNEHDNYMSIKLAAFICKIPVVVGVRFVIGKGFGFWAFGGFCSPNALMFTSNDQYKRSAEALPPNLPKKCIHMIGNGRDLDSFTQCSSIEGNSFRKAIGVPQNAFLIGSASVIRPRKRLEDLIWLISELSETHDDVYGVILGGGIFADKAYMEELESLIIDLKLQDRMFLPGNYDDVAPFYKTLDLFVSTSELETFGMSVCEAMAFKKPVIAYAGGSVKEVINDERCICENGDKEALKDMALRIIDDGKLAQDIAEAGQKRAFKEFNADSLATKTLNIYYEVLQKK